MKGMEWLGLAGVMALLLALALNGQAQETEQGIYTQVLQLHVLFTQDQTAQVLDYQVLPGYLQEDVANGDYLVTLQDGDGRMLYQLGFEVVFGPAHIPEELDFNSPQEMAEYVRMQSQAATAFVSLPYLEDAKSARFSYRGAEMVQVELESFCEKDGACGENENFLTCSMDCPLNQKDRLCLPQADGVCDPDCAEGVDADCKASGSGLPALPPAEPPTPVPSPLPAIPSFFNIPLTVLVGLLGFLVLLAYWFGKKGKS